MLKKNMTTRSELPGIITKANASADAKFGNEINPAAVQLHACIYSAVSIAMVHGVSRRTIEQRAMMGKDALGDYLGAKPDRVMKLDQFAQLLFDPAILGLDGHKALLDEIALRNGRIMLAEPEPEADEHDGLVLEMLDVADATGNLASKVRDAVDPDSPGGTRVTQRELDAIGASGRVVIDETLAMIPHVPGLHEVVA